MYVVRILSTKPLRAAEKARLAAAGDVVCWEGEGLLPKSFLFDAIADVDALLTSGTRVDETLLASAPRLRVVSTSSVGYDHFDIPAMRKHRVLGTHTPGVLDETVADLAFALVLAAARRVVELDNYVRQGHWQRGDDEALYGVDVHHRTLGIVGMGRIGHAVARRARLGFGMNVLYHSRSRHEDVERELQAVYLDLPDLLAASDFVVLLTPLTKDTVGLMNREMFAKMQPSAIFINISRGKTVDESALYEALTSGRIRAAGLDVFEQEPIPQDHPLLKLQNVVALPHIGSATHATRDAMRQLAIDNLIAVIEGRMEDAKIVPELQDLAKELSQSCGQ